MPALSSIAESLSEREEDFYEVLPIGSDDDGKRIQADEVDENDVNSLQNSIIDWTEDETWTPSKDTEEVSTSEEETREEDSESDDSDTDYIPTIRIRPGASLAYNIDELPVATVEDIVYDGIGQDPHLPPCDDPSIPCNSIRVETPEDIRKRCSTEMGVSQCLKDERVVALGDARMDSPGFSAQYCTYTVMDNGSKKIMNIANKDKREAQGHSTIMEKLAFIDSLDKLRNEVNISEICTDAHTQISALFRTGIYNDSGVEHSFDMWHGAKNLGKRIHASGQQRDCKILLQWKKDICNHFWPTLPALRPLGARRPRPSPRPLDVDGRARLGALLVGVKGGESSSEDDSAACEL
uniref:Uncharacterized protein n=1 Tax=Knipowitschia caucasica TaxID=637954 RepID=A0AAV2K9F8_KNICA